MTLPIFTKLEAGPPPTGRCNFSPVSLHRGSRANELLWMECSDIDSSLDSELWIFDCTTETWRLYGNSPINIDVHTAAINQKGDTLWVHDIWETVYKINLCTDEYETVENVGHSGYDCDSVVILDTFYIIKARTRTYLRWNEQQNCFDELPPPPFYVAPDVRHDGVVSINETLLIFVGPTQSEFRSGIQRVYRYDPSLESLPKNKWNCISLEVPIPLFCPKAIAVDNRFVILYGYAMEYVESQNKIFIVDTHTMRYRESVVILPMLSNRRMVIAPRDERKIKETVTGFTRDICKEVDMYPKMTCPPACLITLLARYYENDIAYLLGNIGTTQGQGPVREIHRIKVSSLFEYY